jgi:hypothetical protein
MFFTVETLHPFSRQTVCFYLFYLLLFSAYVIRVVLVLNNELKTILYVLKQIEENWYHFYFKYLIENTSKLSGQVVSVLGRSLFFDSNIFISKDLFISYISPNVIFICYLS